MQKMKKELMYSELAKYYDLIYSLKDYKKEASAIKKLINKYKKSNGKDLLDIACGTGNHLKYLNKNFKCTGIDTSHYMLKIAKRKVRNARFINGDMKTMNLKKKFDAIICLFSSIAYVKSYPNLKKAIANFSRHLKKGGILIIEYWFEKKAFFPYLPFMTTYNSKNLKIARLNNSKITKNVSVLDMHYLIAEKNKKTKYYHEIHELGLFSIKRTLEIMRKAGLSSVYLKKGLVKGRGLLIGVEK